MTNVPPGWLPWDKVAHSRKMVHLDTASLSDPKLEIGLHYPQRTQSREKGATKYQDYGKHRT